MPDYKYGLQLAALAAQLGELGSLVPNVPLAFAKVSDDQYTFVMLTGFADGRNQLVDDTGRWVLQVLPMELQVYPFALQALPQKQEDTAPQFGLSFNHASGLYRESPDDTAGEHRFFTDDGQPQPLLKSVTDQLQKLLGQQRLTQRAVAALLQQELLIPWQIQPREGQPDEVLPKGLYRIDEAKLNALKGEALETLHQAHAIVLAYGQLLSMSRVTVLQRLKDVHAARQKSAAPSSSAAPVPDPSIVQKVFDQGQGDTIKFNF